MLSYDPENTGPGGTNLSVGTSQELRGVGGIMGPLKQKGYRVGGMSPVYIFIYNHY